MELCIIQLDFSFYSLFWDYQEDILKLKWTLGTHALNNFILGLQIHH